MDQLMQAFDLALGAAKLVSKLLVDMPRKNLSVDERLSLWCGYAGSAAEAFDAKLCHPPMLPYFAFLNFGC